MELPRVQQELQEMQSQADELQASVQQLSDLKAKVANLQAQVTVQEMGATPAATRYTDASQLLPCHCGLCFVVCSPRLALMSIFSVAQCSFPHLTLPAVPCRWLVLCWPSCVCPRLCRLLSVSS